MGKKLDNIGHFMFNSDYPVDKIIWLREDTLELDRYTSFVWSGSKLPSIGYPAFIKGICTVDDWETAYPMSEATPFPGTPGSGNTNYAYLEWQQYDWNREGQETFRVRAHMPDYTDKVLRFRIWGVQREDIAMAIDYGRTNNSSKSHLKFDSSKNYPRLVMDGVAKAGETVYHNLGRIPYVDYWYIFANKNSEDPFRGGWTYETHGQLGGYDDPYDNWPSVQATKDVLRFMPSTSGEQSETATDWYYYRIYT